MSQNDACKLPTPGRPYERLMIQRMLAGRRIAIVGLSPDPHKPSFGVADYLRSAGCEIVPVNPNYEMILGLTCYASLAEVPGKIDVVDIFRRPEHCAQVVREAIAVGAKGVWLQAGIVSDEARAIAVAAKLDYVEDRCLKVDHLMAQR